MSLTVAPTTTGDDATPPVNESFATSSTLRQRRPTTNQSLVVEEEEDDEEDDVTDDWSLRRQARGTSATSSSTSAASSPLSAQHLLSAEPLHYGTALKLHLPLVYKLSPLWMKQCLLSMSCMCPRWKSRFVVVLGNFLYRFVHTFGKSPKGRPLPLKHLQSRLINLEDDEKDAHVLDQAGHFLDRLPSNYKAVLELTYAGGRSEEDDSRQYYAFATLEEAEVWHRTLMQGRQEVIRREMGHTANMPYPAKWKYLDSLGQASLERSERIERRMEQAQWKEMEMTTFDGLRGSGGHGIYT